MKHPRIFAGRQGLPSTSNVPWSANRERMYKEIILFDLITLLVSFGTIVFVVFTNERGWQEFVAIPCLLLLGAFNLWRLMEARRILGAMLLNKPRSLEGLTQWTEHPPPQMPDPDAYRFFCACGRLVDLFHAPYFPSTQRWSLVCECGRGHFMPIPHPGQVAHFPSKVKR